MSDFTRRKVRLWEISALVTEFKQDAVLELLDNKVLHKTKDFNGKLAFDVPGTVPAMIFELVSGEPYSLVELLTKLPTHCKLSAGLLKANLSFLMNFHLVQCFTPPGSAITFVASDLDDPVIESAIDKIYAFADELEPAYSYIIDEWETADEFKLLH